MHKQNDDSDKIALLEAILAVRGDPKRSKRRFNFHMGTHSKFGDHRLLIHDTIKRRYAAALQIAPSPVIDNWLREHKLI